MLGNTVTLDGDHYTFSQKLGQDANTVYMRALLDFLDRSRDIAVSFYPTGATEPSIEFEVKVQPSPAVATTQFWVGGKNVEHYNGPEKWKTLTWPGEHPEQGAAIVIRGANGMHERISQDGPWGLFRLLEAGTLMPGAGRTFTIAWQLQTHDVTLQVDFRPKRSESPFFGVPGHAQQTLFLQPVREKGTAAPRQIVHTRQAVQTGKVEGDVGVSSPHRAAASDSSARSRRSPTSCARTSPSASAPRSIRGWSRARRTCRSPRPSCRQRAVRFVFSAAQCDSVAIGVLVKSQDQVGRSFPLAIYTALALGPCRARVSGDPARVRRVPRASRGDPGRCARRSRSKRCATRVGALVPPSDDTLATRGAALRGCAGRVARAPSCSRARSPPAPPDSHHYGLFTFRTATDAARSGAEQRGAPTVLACPLAIDVDLLAWLELARRCLGWNDACPSFAWVESAHARLLLSLGYASDQLLHFVADARHSSSRLWPLTTERVEAIARARDALGADLGRRRRCASVDLVWTRIARGTR